MQRDLHEENLLSSSTGSLVLSWPRLELGEPL